MECDNIFLWKNWNQMSKKLIRMLCQSFHNLIIVRNIMGIEAIFTIFDTVFCIRKIPATLIPKVIKWTKAEQTVKIIWICSLVTGKIFAICMCKMIVFHNRLRGLNKLYLLYHNWRIVAKFSILMCESCRLDLYQHSWLTTNENQYL